MSDDKHHHTPAMRLTFTYGHLVGSLVAVSTVDGLVYEGILSGFGTDPELDDSKDMFVCLSLARCAAPATQRTRIDEAFLVQWRDVIMLEGVDYKYEDDSRPREPAKASFKKQTPNPLPPSTNGDWAMMNFAEELKEHQPGSFNQFEAPANKSAAKDKAGYDERLYTTAMPTNITEEQRKEADRVAAAIEQGGERDADLRDDQDDATMFSDVTKPEKYVIPSKRKNNNATSATTAAPVAPPAAVGAPTGTTKVPLRVSAPPFTPPNRSLFFEVLKKAVADIQTGSNSKVMTILAQEPPAFQSSQQHYHNAAPPFNPQGQPQQGNPIRMGMPVNDMMHSHPQYNTTRPPPQQFYGAPPVAGEDYPPMSTSGYHAPSSYVPNNMSNNYNNTSYQPMNPQQPPPPPPQQQQQQHQPPAPVQGRGGSRLVRGGGGRGRASQ